MPSLESIEIIDAQIHEPATGTAWNDSQRENVHLWQVELAREAMDAVGVDIALAVTSQQFIDVAHARYPGRFPGVPVIFHMVQDMPAAVRAVKANPANVAARALVGDYEKAIMRPEFLAGAYDPLYAAAQEVGLPIFNSTHGGCAHMAGVAEKYPGLTLIVDHIGVAQHPSSPPEAMSWAPFDDLLGLARYPNVHVKLCGAPLLSEQNYPYDDVWPYLDRLFAAFGYDRIMWGSDYTRPRSADRPRGDRPRRRGITYGENLNHLLLNERLTHEQKRLVLGGNVRRLFNLPPISEDWRPTNWWMQR